jgi:type IV pilus assembly protein PilQ
MKTIKFYILVTTLIISLTSVNLFSSRSGEADLISLSENVRFPDAVKIFADYYLQYENKTLLDLSEFSDPIGMNLDSIHWRAAFKSILQYNDLLLTERPNAFVINKKTDLEPEEEIEFIDDILIEATFFEADFNVVRELGIDWSTFVGGSVNISANVSGAAQLAESIVTIDTGTHSFDAGTSRVDVRSLFRALAASDKGHVISTPQVTVSSGEMGTVQDGIDYTILLAGITSTGVEVEQAREVQVQSGTIVRVTPHIILDEERNKAIKLSIRVERSTAAPSPTGYSKTTAEVESFKTLYSGEETIIGGLTTAQTRNLRRGIPLLKDLPWWFFGIRYLTGYDRHEIQNKELIIILKATILPPIHERRTLQRDVAEEIEKQRQRQPELEPKLLP